jgi:hypothetical protein
LTDRQLYFVVFSVAILLLAMGPPVKPDLTHAVVEYDCQIEFVLTEEEVENVCGVGLIADFIVVDGKVPVCVNLVGVCEALVEGEA